MRFTLIFRFLAIIVFLPSMAFSQEFQYRTVENTAFDAGEKLKFRVYYEAFLTGKVDAGTATIEVDNTNRKFNNREVYHIVGVGKSTRAFDLFFRFATVSSLLLINRRWFLTFLCAEPAKGRMLKMMM